MHRSAAPRAPRAPKANEAGSITSGISHEFAIEKSCELQLYKIATIADREKTKELAVNIYKIKSRTTNRSTHCQEGSLVISTTCTKCAVLIKRCRTLVENCLALTQIVAQQPRCVT